MLARFITAAPRVGPFLSVSSHASTSFLPPSTVVPSSRRSLSSSLPSFSPASSNSSTSTSTPPDITTTTTTTSESSVPAIETSKLPEEQDDGPLRLDASPHDPLVFAPPKTTRPAASLEDYIDPTTNKLYQPSLLPRTPKKEPFKVQRQYKNEIDVNPDHPLYAFFHKDPSTNGYLTIEKVANGGLDALRPWKSSELRTKSFQDLHTLWALLLREKNIYYTQKEEMRRVAGRRVARFDWGTGTARRMIQVSMARIKGVLSERQTVYAAEAQKVLAAQRLGEEQLRIEGLEKELDALVQEDWEHDEAEEDERAEEREDDVEKEAVKA